MCGENRGYAGFQSTPPVRGATGIAIERSETKKEFQSTPPVRGATIYDDLTAKYSRFQSTPPVRGATFTGAL